MSETVISLSQMPNWGGGFPRRHEFSTLAGLRNEPMTGDQDMPPVETGGYLDKFHQLADAILSDWGNEFVVPYFYGPPGTGKTHAAIALGRALIERGLGDRVAYKKFSGDMLSFAAYSQNPNHFAHPMYIFGNSPAQLGSNANSNRP